MEINIVTEKERMNYTVVKKLVSYERKATRKKKGTQ
jgi:hypothetical protein